MPQGSVLLFLIYVNDICKSSEILSFILFADDPNSVLKSPRFKSSQQYHESRIREGHIVASSKQIIIKCLKKLIL